MTTAQIASITREGLTRVSHGLYVQVRGASRTWMLRYRFGGRQQLMSIGPVRLFTLLEAKRRAHAAQQRLHDGIDPKATRDAERRSTAMTFDQCADACIRALKPQWRSGDVQEQQWRNQLATYAYPSIGSRPVDAITMNDIVKVLEKVWTTKTESATRLRERLEKVFDWATSAGERSGLNPARWKGGLEHRLPKPSAIQKKQHHAAVAVAEAPGVYQAIKAKTTTTAKLLQFVALNAVRVSEASKATWSEIDIDARLWVVPASRTKTGKELRVPLSDEALRVLGSPGKPSDVVFKGLRGKPLSDTAVRMLLRRVTGGDETTHGWRSTFRDFVAERGLDAEAAEQALGHKAGDAVVVAYLRSDVLERRRALMDAWAAFLTGHSE